jgi:hypothetical protein
MTAARPSRPGPEHTDVLTVSQRLEREAAQALADALAGSGTLHERGQRERYRLLLERALEQANGALAAAEEERGSLNEVLPGSERARLLATLTAARATLVEAGAAKAEDALHGAGQLSLSAQRAPTREACEDGWQRVEAIVLGAEAAARVVANSAAELENDAAGSALARAASKAARRAEASARAARRLVEERNHAYTFHVDSGFSFGEGWYVAAAAILAGVAIQIEPAANGRARAERFLRDAGLEANLRPYRSRPRAMKQTTELVARAFKADAASAQRRLRAGFLGHTPIPSSLVDWVERRLPPQSTRNMVLLWNRDGVHHPDRNSDLDELFELTRRVHDAGLLPAWTGDAIRNGQVPEGAVDLILFWKDPLFLAEDMRRAQLQFFEQLKARHGLVGQLGVTTAGMDGPALMGLPTMYLTDEPNVRMREWVGAVPGYQEVVRDSGYLERVTSVLTAWANGGARQGCVE